MLNLNEIKKITNNHSFSAKPETLQVYTFSGEGSSSDHLPMKQKRKSTKTVSEYPFKFFERKNQKTKFESPYSDQLQTAIKGTNHTITTADNKIIHRKLISNPIKPFEQEPSNRGTGPRGPDGRFARKESKSPETPRKSQSQEDQLDTSPEPPNTKKNGTFGRGRPKMAKLIGEKGQESPPPEVRPGSHDGNDEHLGTLTANTEQMSESDIEQIIEDTQESGQELHIRDHNGKVTYDTFDKIEESDLELASNLSSSTEIEKDLEKTEENNLRRSKRLTKTNPIVRLNNPVNQDCYRKHSKKTKPATFTGDTGGGWRAGRRRKQLNHSTEKQNANHGSPDLTIANHGSPDSTTANPGSPDQIKRRGLVTGHKTMDCNGTPLDSSHPIVEGEMKNKEQQTNLD